MHPRNVKNVYEFHGDCGRLVYNDGAVYYGSFAHGKRHGHGMNFMQNCKGDRYVGPFVQDKASGEGEIFYANGDVYRGGVKDFKKHGKGVLKYICGGGYEGDFADDRFHGSGT